MLQIFVAFETHNLVEIEKAKFTQVQRFTEKERCLDLAFHNFDGIVCKTIFQHGKRTMASVSL